MKKAALILLACCALAVGLSSCATAGGAPDTATAAGAGAAPATDTTAASGAATPATAEPGTLAPLPPDAVISWTDEALQAFQTEVPKMVQKIARRQMEKQARERGIAVIDMAFYEEIKKEQGH
jgi:hypothetical protein